MKAEDKKRFLFERMMGLTLAAVLFAWWRSLPRGSHWGWPVGGNIALPAVLLSLVMLFLVCVWGMVIVPYKRRERAVEQLLRGYAGAEGTRGVIPLEPVRCAAA